jgi:hypothetical protein
MDYLIIISLKLLNNILMMYYHHNYDDKCLIAICSASHTTHNTKDVVVNGVDVE